MVPITQPNVFEFFERIPNEDAAHEYLESARWPDGVSCIHCGHHSVWKVKSRRLYTCKNCREQFTIRTGTVMEDSKIPLRKWVFAMYLMTVSRKGVSSVQVAKELGITQKSAWFMAHRIREACKSKGMLTGEVEADETFVGGKKKNKHASKKRNSGRGPVGKTIVFGVKSRQGEVRTQILDTVDGKSIRNALSGSVAVGATLYTDDHRAYLNNPEFVHFPVNHSGGQYVVGSAHTNSIESFWSVIKRAHYGVFHYWSAKHIDRYMNEFSFKANTEGLPAFDKLGKDDGITVIRAYMAGMKGRRLTYKELIAHA